MEWFYIKDGERVGPVQAEAIRTLILEKSLGPDDMVWNKTMGETWSKLSTVYIFSVHFQKTSAATDADFSRRLEEKRLRELREKATRTKGLIAAGVAALILGTSFFFWKQGEDLRIRGIDTENPLGTLPKYESILIGTYQMDRQVAQPSELLQPSTDTGTIYSNPKAGIEDHVNGKGSISLFARGDRVTRIFSEFMTPGNRGPLMIDKSITSIQMLTLWKLLTGSDVRVLKFISEAPTDITTRFGLTKFPGDGTYATFENSSLSAIWVEHGQFCAHSLLLVTLK